MRNSVNPGLCAFLCVCICLILGSPAMAGGSGSSNGKTPSRARIVINNNDTTATDYLVFIRPEGSPLPATAEAVRDASVAVAAMEQNVSSSLIRNGNLTVSLFFADDVNGEIAANPGQPLTQDLFDLGEQDAITVALNGEDIEINIEGDPTFSALELAP